jgi:CheY-like chemotaxis protein
MSAPEILILEDDPVCASEHQKRLEGAGLKCHLFHSAEDAVNFARKHLSIKFGLIDEILWTVENPDNPSEQQRWQGKDAILQIDKTRPGMWFIFVTKAPLIWSNGDVTKLEEERELLRQASPRVVSIFSKNAFEVNPDAAYDALTSLIWQLFHEGRAFQTIVEVHKGGQIAVYKFDNTGIVNLESQVGQQTGCEDKQSSDRSSEDL